MPGQARQWLCGLLAVAALSWWGTAEAEQTAASSPITVTISSIIAEGAKQLDEAVSYTITKPGDRSNVVGSVVAPIFKTDLQPGRYRLAAVYGNTTVEETLTVTKSPLNHVVNFNAGWVRLKAVPIIGGKEIAKDISWEILSFGKNYKGERASIVSSNLAQPSFVLPAGWYVANVVANGASLKHTIEVTPGHTYKYTVIMNTGTAKISAVSKGNALKGGVTLKIFERGDAQVGEPVAVLGKQNGEFNLREGNYTVIATSGERSGSADFAVKAGKKTSAKVTIQ